MEIIREKYLEQLDNWREANLIKVLIGIRRCGKSTIMRQYAQQLKEQGVSEGQILFYNFESPSVLRELGRNWEEIFFCNL
ncbi:MAG: AAA family ATPase [Micrococcaceae bacterium]